MKSRRRVAAGMMVVGGLVIASPVGQATGDDPVANSVPEAGALVPEQQPQLARSDDDRALSIVAKDADLASLLGGARYTVTDQGPWTDDSPSQTKLGAVVTLHLNAPASLNGQWPTMTYTGPSSTAAPYTTRLATLSATNVTDLLVTVDTTFDQRVVSVEPNPDATVTPGPNEPTTTPPAVGDED